MVYRSGDECFVVDAGVMFPGQEHGTELFGIKHKRAFTQLLFDFLAGIRS